MNRFYRTSKSRTPWWNGERSRWMAVTLAGVWGVLLTAGVVSLV